MATLTYWKAEMKGDDATGADALRGKTKKEVLRQIEQISNEEFSDCSFEAPKKMMIIYKDAFDLMECVVFNDA
jgi:hypothetical protein